jgi:hypothetical protein
MAQIAHDNHFVPQSYLRRWSNDGHNIFCYRLLVPDRNFPEWENRPIKGVAYQKDLYTYIKNKSEIDEYEHWLEKNIETPSVEAIEHVRCSDKLTLLDWEKLILLFAAQDVRTPANYRETIVRWQKQLPGLMSETLHEVKDKLIEAKEKGIKIESNPSPENEYLSEIFKFEIIRDYSPSTNEGALKVTVLPGRRSWILNQKHAIEKLADVLLSHKWSIAVSSPGNNWYTSDNPAVRLNYQSDSKYDFKGGWNRIGTDLFMQLTPNHLMFTEIGRRFDDQVSFTKEQTLVFQKFIALHADKMIFSKKRDTELSKYRSREINREAYLNEEKQWEEWNSSQSKAEQDFYP